MGTRVKRPAAMASTRDSGSTLPSMTGEATVPSNVRLWQEFWLAQGPRILSTGTARRQAAVCASAWLGSAHPSAMANFGVFLFPESVHADQQHLIAAALDDGTVEQSAGEGRHQVDEGT